MANRDSREEVMKVFRLFTDLCLDYITFRNLKRVVTELNEGLSDDEMMEMIDEADRNNDGKIDFEEFFRVMKKRGDNLLDDLDSMKTRVTVMYGMKILLRRKFVWGFTRANGGNPRYMLYYFLKYRKQHLLLNFK